ncbi:MAG TPA: hypothetical protein VNJ29_00605, partial [Candidatus Nitrosotenuis sp.]|nr:hypothetical protein [Candidatus Nitrosotenuis sp.]
MKNNLLKLSIFFTFLTFSVYAHQEEVCDHDHQSKYSLLKQRIICEDGSQFSIAANANLPKSITIAKNDGPIVYAEDKKGRLYSLEFNEKTKELERTKIFRLPIVGRLYFWLWDNRNVIQLPKINNEGFAKWAISYFTYPEGGDVRTISLFIMTQTNPIKIRNMDPWLLPWNTYEHAGPFGMTGVDIAAGGETVAIVGYQKNFQKV